MTERKIALSIEEAADYTGMGRTTLRKLVEWKQLPVLKVGRKVLIKTDIVEKFMEANEGRDLRDKGNVKTVTRNVATYLFGYDYSFGNTLTPGISISSPMANQDITWEKTDQWNVGVDAAFWSNTMKHSSPCTIYTYISMFGLHIPDGHCSLLTHIISGKMIFCKSSA